MDHFRKEFDREMDVDPGRRESDFFLTTTTEVPKGAGGQCVSSWISFVCVCSVFECLNWKTKETNSLQGHRAEFHSLYRVQCLHCNWEAMKKRIGEVNTSRDL